MNSTDDDIICMDNKSDTPTVLSHTSIIGMYKTHNATIAYYAFSFLQPSILQYMGATSYEVSLLQVKKAYGVYYMVNII